jgi:hypothetical protein
MKTLSLFPRKTAQPPLVGKTARTCTSMTVLFIRANRISPVTKNKRGGSALRRLPFAIVLVLLLLIVLDLSLFSIPSKSTSNQMKTGLVRRAEIFAMRACMSAAVIEYALCGFRCSRKNEDRVGC